MNDVSLIGRLTRDPELIATHNGTDIATLRLAGDRRRDDGAVFVDVKGFEGQACACAEHLAKGRQVAVSGRLELDEWTNDKGEKRSRLYVIANAVQFLTKRSTSPEAERAQPQPAAAALDGTDTPCYPQSLARGGGSARPPALLPRRSRVAN